MDVPKDPMTGPHNANTWSLQGPPPGPSRTNRYETQTVPSHPPLTSHPLPGHSPTMILGLFPVRHPCFLPKVTSREISDLPLSNFLQTHFSTPETLLGFCFLILCAFFATFLAYIVFITIPQWILNAFLNRRFPNFKAREIGLIGNAMMSVGTFGMAAGFFLDLYNIQSWFFYLFPTIIFLGLDLIDRSHLPNFIHPIFIIFVFLFSIIVTAGFYFGNEQSLIPACHPHLNLLIGAHIWIISWFLTASVCFYGNLQAIRYAEKLYLKKDGKVIGYAVKKAEQWVYYDEKDCDKDELICNV